MYMARKIQVYTKVAEWKQMIMELPLKRGKKQV
jgi:hypothetical protein